ncbi:hypothetical protein EJ05DRAFT_340854 [Pseudovirgaria hyperparasitica]|uniref:Uncharacterized protein n=1 Tax=Pseudovirgaria hyperparasitica TaxID=470096 RepID=A0A6A6WDV0_9PEZI|nr:uncharacterized protein EJ05DRAFT_340854 [Pseudovirgaria hyperparasitica]KAF2759291.1 hypothetical protein EJ05DRAFT_340854 [Pseudovirgaria hyperparasitica]
MSLNEYKKSGALPVTNPTSRPASRSAPPMSTYSISAPSPQFRSTTPNPPNKDKPLPPPPPTDRRMYPTINPYKQPRASPVPPTANYRGPSLEKASKILGTSTLLTTHISQVAQGPRVQKANQLLGLTGEDPVQVHSHRRTESTNRFYHTSSWESPDSLYKEQYYAAAKNLEPVFNSKAEDKREDVQCVRGHRRDWESSSTQSSRTRSDSSGSMASVSSKRPSQRKMSSASHVLHRQKSSLSRIPSSPSSVYSAGLDSSAPDLDSEIVESQAFWAARPLTVTRSDSVSSSLETEGLMPQSLNIRRRSRSLADLHHTEKLPPLFEPLPLEAVPEWATTAPQAVDTQVAGPSMQIEAIKNDATAVPRASSPSTQSLLEGSSRSGSRSEMKIASKVMKRLTLTRQGTSIQDEPQARQFERPRTSVSWARAYTTVKSLGKEKISVDEIIPMRGPNAVPAAQQAEMRERLRHEKLGSRDKIPKLDITAFNAALASRPLAPTSHVCSSETQMGKREMPSDTSNSGAKSNTQIIVPTSSGARSPSIKIEESQSHVAVEVDSNELYEAGVSEPVNQSQTSSGDQSLLTVQKEEQNRDSSYYKSRIAAANSLFDKFIQNPDEHQVKLQQLIDDTRHERKTTIEGAAPLETWYSRQQYETEESTKASDVKTSEHPMPSQMPFAPALQPAPHTGISAPISRLAATASRQNISLRLDTRLPPSQHTVNRKPSRRGSRQGNRGRSRGVSKNGMRSPRTPVTKHGKGAVYSIFPVNKATTIKKAASLPTQTGPASSNNIIGPGEAGQSNAATSIRSGSLSNQVLSAPPPASCTATAAPMVSHQPVLPTLAPTVYVPPTKKTIIDVPPATTTTAVTTFSPVSPGFIIQQHSPLLAKNTPVMQPSAFEPSIADLVSPTAAVVLEHASTTDDAPWGPESPVLPQLEVSMEDDENSCDDDAVSVKSYSHIAPGIETPNYHSLDWWELSPTSLGTGTPELEGDGPGVRFSHGHGGRTVAEIKSWQFDLDDELAKLRKWDWTDKGHNRMMFTLDFDAPAHAP